MTEDEARDALRRHWAASDVNDFAAEHEIYRSDAVLEYPQSGERIRGRAHIEAPRAAQPNAKRFTVRRVLGAGDLWVSELVMTYDGQPNYVVSIMESRTARWSARRNTSVIRSSRDRCAHNGSSPLNKQAH